MGWVGGEGLTGPGGAERCGFSPSLPSSPRPHRLAVWFALLTPEWEGGALTLNLLPKGIPLFRRRDSKVSRVTLI